MEPDHDRPLLAVIDTRRPDIEVLAIIVHSEAAGRFFPGRIGERAHFLRRNVAVVHGQLRPLPGRHGLSRFEAFFRFSIRDAVVRIDSLADIALDPAACRLDDGNARPGLKSRFPSRRRCRPGLDDSRLRRLWSRSLYGPLCQDQGRIGHQGGQYPASQSAIHDYHLFLLLIFSASSGLHSG